MERIWFDSKRESFFSIPDTAELTEGELALRTATGLRKQVDPESVEPYRISRAEATDRLGARIDEAWGSFVGTVDRVLSAGRLAARQAGVNLREQPDEGEGAGRSPLPEHLSDWLGMAPGELLTNPDRVRERLREAAAQAGIHIKPRDGEGDGDSTSAEAAADDAPTPAPAAAEETPEEVIEDAEEVGEDADTDAGV